MLHHLYVRSYAQLCRTASAITLDHPAAEEVVQECFVKVLARPDLPATYAYVHRMVVNAAIDEVRRARRRTALHARLRGRWRESRPAEDANLPLSRDLAAALRDLGARQRSCVVLKYAFDLSDEEISGLLGVRESTVRSQASRGMAAVRRVLGEEGRGHV